MFRLLRSLFILIPLILFFIVILTVLTQDVQILPGVRPSNCPSVDPPPGMESYFVTTSDGKRIEVWHMGLEGSQPGKRKAAIIFRGNAGSLQTFIALPQWFQSLGVESFIFNYRGFGRSSGWPSETGIYRDGEAVWNNIVRERGFHPGDVTILGTSLGSGPAAQLASIMQPKTLILLAPYSSIPDIVRSFPFLGYLAPFLWYDFPTAQYVSKIQSKCLIIAHCARDTVIPSQLSARVEQAYHGSGRVHRLIAAEGYHSQEFSLLKPELTKLYRECEDQSG